jgi:N6-adenosine-specific RNA methylase IME4
VNNNLKLSGSAATFGVLGPKKLVSGVSDIEISDSYLIETSRDERGLIRSCHLLLRDIKSIEIFSDRFSGGLEHYLSSTSFFEAFIIWAIVWRKEGVLGGLWTIGLGFFIVLFLIFCFVEDYRNPKKFLIIHSNSIKIVTEISKVDSEMVNQFFDAILQQIRAE